MNKVIVYLFAIYMALLSVLDKMQDKGANRFKSLFKQADIEFNKQFKK